MASAVSVEESDHLGLDGRPSPSGAGVMPRPAIGDTSPTTGQRGRLLGTPAAGTTEVAIVGLGSWGLCVLERFVDLARTGRRSFPTRLHVIEPDLPGVGIYAQHQPDYYLMNTACGQMCLSPWPERHETSYALTLWEWAVQQGYRWVGESCLRGRTGRPLTEHDFLPRRVMGEYLAWFYAQLVASRPPALEIIHHQTSAVDVVNNGRGRERISLADGTSVLVDHVIITCGHTENRGERGGRPGVTWVAPYPSSKYSVGLSRNSQVTIAGMGLVAADVLAALTVGRGGSFHHTGDRQVYRPSGFEPQIRLYSRGGLFHAAKAVGQRDTTDEYRLGIWTDEVTSAFRQGRAKGQRLDARSDLLPLIYAEMHLAFYTQAERRRSGQIAAERMWARLSEGWRTGEFPPLVREVAVQHGHFDPSAHVFPGQGVTFADSGEYQSWVRESVAADLKEALRTGGESPLKAAYEVLRYLRDPMRRVIEFGGLTASSYLDFASNIRGRLTRLVAGPPAIRAQNVLALIDSGVLTLPFGPSPEVSADGVSGQTVTSTRLSQRYRAPAGTLIRGYLDDPSVHRSVSPLLSNLYRRGRLSQFRQEGSELGSVDLTPDFHPISRQGEEQPSLWVFGVLTEGVRYFTYYVPSPHSRVRAFLDAQICVQKIWG